MADFRVETDSLGEVKVPAEKLWGAQTQRALEYFSIGTDSMPREMIAAYAILKKAAALANSRLGQLSSGKKDLIVSACDEIIEGKHDEMFPLNVWMSGSGTQFNMNVNEVIANRCSQISGEELGSKKPVHPNDDVNMSQSTNDTFPSAMNICAASSVRQKLIPAAQNLRDGLDAKAHEWKDIVKIGRTHMQDATPLTLGQEFSGYVCAIDDNIKRLNHSLEGVYALAIGGTAVGTGINASEGFGEGAAQEISKLTGMPFISAPNKFAVQGSHDALVHMSATLKTLAVTLNKIANDIRLLSCGPRAGLGELLLPANEPGSSIMPGKVNPSQCEALAMIATQVMANDVAVAFGGAGGHLQMNAYKPLIIFNIMNSVHTMSDGMNSFRKYLVDGMKPNKEQIAAYVARSLMLVTALSPAIGYDKAAEVAHYALNHDMSLKDAALKLKYVAEEEFDRLVDPTKMI